LGDGEDVSPKPPSWGEFEASTQTFEGGGIVAAGRHIGVLVSALGKFPGLTSWESQIGMR